MTAIEILKMKLGISSNVKDDYFNALINATLEEFENMGIGTATEDLVADYTLYKHKSVDTLPQNLRLRLNNAKLKNART